MASQASTDGAPQAATTQADGTTTQSIVNMHGYKMQPPTFTGEYGTFEEWEYKFQAYMGLMDHQLPQPLENSENSTTTIREADLVAAANNTDEANKWIQPSTDLRYILVNICSGSAATICRQYQTHNGFEIYRQLCSRFSIPLGTMPIGYLTKFLKPTFDMNNFEETFSQWEFELNKFERDNGQALPESVKIAVILQQHSVQQVKTTNIIKCKHKPWWRNSANGHLRNKRKRKRIQRKGQTERKEQRQRKRLRRIQRKRKGIQRLRKRSSWTRQSFRFERTISTTDEQRQRKRTQRKTSTRRMLQMWTTWTHRKAL